MNSKKDPKSVVFSFIDCINRGDSKGLIAHQTEDFTFIDMEGDITHGRDGWEDYFTSFPEYKIHVEKILVSGNGAAIIGKSTGSHVDPKLEALETVLWIAEVRDGFVSKWRIYSDIEEAKKKVGLS